MRRFFERASSRRHALFLLVALSGLFSIINPKPVSAYYWQGVTPSGTIFCADGIQCALQVQAETYGLIIQGGCYYTYGYSGNLSQAVCEGWNNRYARFARYGYATLICESGETPTSDGCATTPPPKKRPSCEQQTPNPIDIGSGLKLRYALDYADADNRLTLERYYFSNLSYVDDHSISRLGTGWKTNFDVAVFSLADIFVSIILPTGQQLRFGWAGGGYVQQYFDWTNRSWYSGAQGETASLFWDGPNSRLLLTTQDGTLWNFENTGHLRTKTFRDGYVQSLHYDSNGRNDYVEDNLGRRIDFTYNANGLMVSAQVLNGPKFQYAYLGHYQADVDTDPFVIDSIPSSRWTLEYAIQPDQTPGSDTDNPRIRYHYENTSFPFVLTGITDERGVRVATYTYDTGGRAIQEEGANGTETYQLSFNDVANTTTLTNPLSKQAIYHFSKDLRGNNRVTQIEGIASSHCAASNGYYAYDSNNFISDVTDEEGRVTHYVRDARGNPTTITRAYGTGSAQTNTYTWHSTINVPTQAVEPGLTTDYTWTSGQLTQVTQTDTTSQTVPYSTNGQTRTWAFTYSTTGLLLTANGPLSSTGDTVTYTYNTNGYVATITNEVSQVTTVNTWNGRGQPLTVTDPNSVGWTLTYDDLGRVKTITQDSAGAAATTSFDYNLAGDITKATRPNGAYLQYTYDDARRVTKVQDNTGAYIEYDRDNMGNATARRIKDAGGTLKLSQTAVFDELGRLLNFVGAASQTWTHAYDKTSNLVSVTDPRSNVYGWSFDGLNRLISTTDESSFSETLTRNGKDEITNYSDPRSLSTSYVRNGFGDVIQRASPDSGTTVYTYNALGKPTQIVDGRSVTTNLTYDNAGRLLTKQYPAATAENITYTWDSTASGNKGVGRLTKIDDASGSVEWTYNSIGQVTAEKKTTSSNVYVVGYTYDLDGNVTQITYPSGRTVAFSRGSTGLATGVTTKKDSGSSVVTLASSVSYQPFGALQSLTYGNSLILTKTFTQDYNLSALSVAQGATTILSRSFGYGNNDFNITGITDAVVAGRSDTYAYTANEWLQTASGTWGTQTYTQDGVGNRTADVFNDGTTTTTKALAYPSINNLVQNVTQSSTTLRAFGYDGAGNITSDNRGGTVYNYRYNKRGRLDRLTIGSTVTADYTYDALERMAIRTTQNMTPASTTHYIYDRAGRLIAEASGSGATQREYIWIDDMPLAIVADVDTGTPKLWYQHPDHLNRPTKMTDSSQTVVWDAWYTAYGEVKSITGTATNNVRFPGQYYLVESGLHYNWYRHYDPTLGRYLQADPLREVLLTRSKDVDPVIPSAEEIGGYVPVPPKILQLPQVTISEDGAFQSISTGIQIDDKLELPEFINGASIYSYALSAPALYVDPTGTSALSLLLKYSKPIAKYCFGKGGLLNSNRYLRIGIGRKGGDEVFRISGDIVPGGHIDLYKIGPIRPRK